MANSYTLTLEQNQILTVPAIQTSIDTLKHPCHNGEPKCKEPTLTGGASMQKLPADFQNKMIVEVASGSVYELAFNENGELLVNTAAHGQDWSLLTDTEANSWGEVFALLSADCHRQMQGN